MRDVTKCLASREPEILSSIASAPERGDRQVPSDGTVANAAALATFSCPRARTLTLLRQSSRSTRRCMDSSAEELCSCRSHRNHGDAMLVETPEATRQVDVAIVGGGLSGSLAAVILGR